MKLWFSRERGNASKESPHKDSVQKALDDLLSFATETDNSSVLRQARELYFGKIGQVFEDDPDFDQRMSTFLEWYIFDYKSGGAETSTLFEKFVDSRRGSLSSEKMIFLMAIGKHTHSVFLVQYSKQGRIKLKDLVTGTAYWLASEDNLEKGDVIEKRIICIDNSCCLFNTYSLHPKQAYKPIFSEMKKMKKSGVKPDFFVTLQAMQVKWRRSRNIKVRDIYNF